MPGTFRVLAAIAIAFGAIGCSGLPVAGPLTSDVLANKDGTNPAHVDYVLIDVSDAVCRTLAVRPMESLNATFGTGGPPPPHAIGIGDYLSVTIWEAGPGLFSNPVPVAGTQVSVASRGVSLPELAVAQDGMITVPYLGRLPVAGRKPSEVEQQIVAGLNGKAVNPQAIVTVVKSSENTVTVGGEVGAGARVPLSIQGDRVLDVVAAAGGVRVPVNEAIVRLTRQDRTLGVPYSVILGQPKENIFVQPGDIVTVVRSPQTFTAFGAVGRNFQISFEADSITAEEAIAKAGGLLDQRADPTGLFVFRYEPAALVRQLAPAQVPQAQAGLVPVIYRLDMKDAGAYFLAREFSVRDKDIVYVANAPLNEVQKFLALIGSALGPAATTVAAGTSISAATK